MNTRVMVVALAGLAVLALPYAVLVVAGLCVMDKDADFGDD